MIDYTEIPQYEISYTIILFSKLNIYSDIYIEGMGC